MSKKEKLYTQLDELEQHFRKLLIKVLQHAKSHGSYNAFLHPVANSFPDVYNLNDEPQKSLIDLSSQIEKLREILCEESEDGIVGLHKKYAIELNDLQNDHRLGPKRLAEKFLNEI